MQKNNNSVVFLNMSKCMNYKKNEINIKWNMVPRKWYIINNYNKKFFKTIYDLQNDLQKQKEQKNRLLIALDEKELEIQNL